MRLVRVSPASRRTSIFSYWPSGPLSLLLGAVSLAVGLIVGGYLVRFALEIAANVLGRPLSRRDKLVLAAFVPPLALLAWKLSFRQFSYGMVAAFALAGALIWTRNLLRGETWISPQENRFNSEYIGPAALLLIAVLMAWNAWSPFI